MAPKSKTEAATVATSKTPASPAKAKAPAKAKTAKAKTAKTAKTAAKKSPTRKVAKKTTSKAAPAPASKGKPTKARVSNGTALVIVESPAKAKTIKKYLGAGYDVKASVGHVKDLPKSKLGVDIAHGFEPEYEIISGKTKIIADIKKSAKDVDIVYLAPDPDREGEAIAWHLAEEIRPANGNIKRILFNEITKRGITEALAHPGELDRHKFDSQQTRRILDRLVGYEVSPLLWKKVRRGLSAGRVQSVAVRMIVDREGEIKAFTPVEYWSIEARVSSTPGSAGHEPPPFKVKLAKLDGDAARARAVPNEAEAKGIVAAIRAGALTVEKVDKKERKKNPLAPFITSRLQQEAAKKLRFTARKTMTLAQRLYEGMELGEEGPVGLITYMRTDSTRLSDDAVAEVRQYIRDRYGAESLPDEPVIYKTKKSAQDAHEAIRPTSMKYDPETVKRLLVEAAKGDQAKVDDQEDFVRLYQLIWNRFVACQMKPAVFDATTIDIAAGGGATLRASGQVLKFAGFTAVYDESREAGEAASDEDATDGLLPDVGEGETLRLVEILPEQHFTQPPPRFSEASLVKELEEKGIGRPSTYAAILSTIQDRGYCEKREGRFFPTLLGTKVNELLVDAFPDILEVSFTAGLEEELDKVEEGEADWHQLLARFYKPFKIDLDHAEEHMRDLKREETPTEHVCEKCGKPMVIKFGRNGEFLACTGYPECKNTKEFVRNDDGTIRIVEPTPVSTDEKCDKCGSPMVVKRGRFGEFLACTKYPECKGTKPITLGISCPKCGTGQLGEKRSRKGKVFYGCNNYSKTGCDFVLWDRPMKEACPQCGAPFLVKRETRRGPKLRCVKEGCGYTQEPQGEGGGGENESDVTDSDESSAA